MSTQYLLTLQVSGYWIFVWETRKYFFPCYFDNAMCTLVHITAEDIACYDLTASNISILIHLPKYLTTSLI